MCKVEFMQKHPTNGTPDLYPDTDLQPACQDEQQIRATIDRLQRELAAREADERHLPSSVMRAYQALIDKYIVELNQISGNRTD